MKAYRFLDEADQEFQEHIGYFISQSLTAAEKFVDEVRIAVDNIRQYRHGWVFHALHADSIKDRSDAPPSVRSGGSQVDGGRVGNRLSPSLLLQGRHLL